MAQSKVRLNYYIAFCIISTNTPTLLAYYAAQDDTEDYNRYPNAIISDAESLDEFLFNGIVDKVL